MAAYIVGRVNLHDPETYKNYTAQTPDSIARFGGKFIVRGGRNELLEGDNPEFNRVVVIEFPSYEQAKAWYQSPQYQEILPIRQAASEAQIVLVEGV